MALQYDIREIRALYERGENIIQWVRRREEAEDNTPTAIAYSYDMQAGSYIAELGDPYIAELKRNLANRIAPVLDSLTPRSLLEAGVGEATSLMPILKKMSLPPKQVLGFDLSLSRLLYARRHLDQHDEGAASLFMAGLDRIPLADASVDVVLTLHSLEPNGGREKAMLTELLRVARRHLVLVEPSFELGGDETRAWIERHGYVRGLPETLTQLGYPARVVEPLGIVGNPMNVSALIIVDKESASDPSSVQFVSPISNMPLVRRHDCYFCPDDGHAFPIIAGIPCLTIENAVLASKLDQF